MNEKDLVVDRDAQLMLGLQKGDEQCFDQLFEKYKRPVANFAYRFTGRRDIAEELAQDILVKCYLGADTYQPNSKLSTWIFRIARNHCLNEVRRQDYRYRSVPLPEYGDEQPASMNSPEEEVEAAELKRTVGAVLAALPEKQRMALLLSRQQSMSYEEIAQALGTSISAVKSLLNRAKNTLLERLGKLAEENYDL